jgi:hypothetical protein
VLRIYFGLRFANGFGAVYKTQPMERVASIYKSRIGHIMKNCG